MRRVLSYDLMRSAPRSTRLADITDHIFLDDSSPVLTRLAVDGLEVAAGRRSRKDARLVCSSNDLGRRGPIRRDTVLETERGGGVSLEIDEPVVLARRVAEKNSR